MRYMLLIYTEESAMGPETSRPDAQPWIDYTEWLVRQGIHRGGEPLAPTSSATSVRVREGRPLVTDGPFTETKEVLGGYYILECEDLDTALEAAGRCPAAAIGTIEVRPLAPMPGAGIP